MVWRSREVGLIRVGLCTDVSWRTTGHSSRCKLVADTGLRFPVEVAQQVKSVWGFSESRKRGAHG